MKPPGSGRRRAPLPESFTPLPLAFYAGLAATAQARHLEAEARTRRARLLVTPAVVREWHRGAYDRLRRGYGRRNQEQTLRNWWSRIRLSELLAAADVTARAALAARAAIERGLVVGLPPYPTAAEAAAHPIFAEPPKPGAAADRKPPTACATGGRR